MKKAPSLLSRNSLLSGGNRTFREHVRQGENGAVKGLPEERAFQLVQLLAE